MTVKRLKQPFFGDWIFINAYEIANRKRWRCRYLKKVFKLFSHSLRCGIFPCSEILRHASVVNKACACVTEWLSQTSLNYLRNHNEKDENFVHITICLKYWKMPSAVGANNHARLLYGRNKPLGFIARRLNSIVHLSLCYLCMSKCVEPFLAVSPQGWNQ